MASKTTPAITEIVVKLMTLVSSKQWAFVVAAVSNHLYSFCSLLTVYCLL